ncbi:MAG: thiamine biosynthesis protein ThiS [Deltaproteobacteria bacterium]|nr:MAG: thiamine biosynthesis protein ThiS [Deltaproteobacteria bacterium]
MKLQVNGTQTSSSAASLSELITELQLTRESLVVEHNTRIIRQQDWASTRLKEGDIIELLNFVGGG